MPRHVSAIVSYALFAAAAFAQAPAWYQTDFPPEEFRARWVQVFDKIGSESVLVMQGVAQTRGYVMPRQTNEFYYLCGLETPHSYLLLDGRDKKVRLYLPPRNERLERAEGKVLSAEDAAQVKKLTGADEVLSTAAMSQDWLARLPRGAPQTIYTLLTPAEGNSEARGELTAANNAIAADMWDGRIAREAHFAQLLRTRYPRATITDITPVLDAMRVVKSPREIAIIRRASEIAGLGLMEAMRGTKAGVYEYELDAAARYVFLLNGARLEGYRSITAAGTQNIANMHYYRNMSRLDDGQMVLMDFAPEYHYYTSDIGRMWPVNGKFLPWQRELLQVVLDYRNAIIKRIRPGVTTRQIMDEAKIAMESVFAKTKFSKPEYEEAARVLVERGGGVFSHSVGLSVHDDGNYNREPLKPGQVFSIDPAIRVPGENLYLRYEDVVVVTATGCENFTAFLPSELDDLENLVRQGRPQRK
ncbi:MAG: aminopeptidase P N-terminal domain-containing protein [Candidatus Solibacter usitatus]|nr:aminopeptidase P N-terminal domain-containing protein [Candidatus Solibacter usitatus]